MPTFTHDWFSHNIAGLNQLLPTLKERARFLEIGCFEGLSTCWFLTHHLANDGEIVCVDTFRGGIEHGGVDYTDIRNRFEANTAEVKRPNQTIRIFEDTSVHAMAVLLAEGAEFDFIYVDGSHTAPDVMADACMAFHLLKIGGFMVFDDYLWGPKKPIHNTPKMAVDMFMMLYKDYVELVMLNYQLGVRKVANPVFGSSGEETGAIGEPRIGTPA